MPFSQLYTLGCLRLDKLVKSKALKEITAKLPFKKRRVSRLFVGLSTVDLLCLHGHGSFQADRGAVNH